MLPTNSTQPGRARSVLGVLLLVLSLLTAAQVAGAAAPPNPSDEQLRQAELQKQRDARAVGVASAQLAAVEAEILRLEDELDAKIAAYDATTRDLFLAVEERKRADAALEKARTTTAQAKDRLAVFLTDRYKNGAPAPMSQLFLSPDPNAALGGADLQRYAGRAHENQVQQAVVDTVAFSNAAVVQKAAQQKAEALQAKAKADKDAVMTQMATTRQRKAELAARRTVLAQQAAAAAARLRGLQGQRAAYEAWQAAERARLAREAAERARRAAEAAERARQAAEAAERARQEAQQQQGSYQPPSYSPPPVTGNWAYPMRPGTYSVSSCFCARWGTFHYGTDLAAGFGVPIYSVSSGTVVASGPASGFGNWIVIDHGNGISSVYGHMRDLDAWVGQRVSPGTLIAYVGSEGQSTGPHLHLEIWNYGTKIDPEVFLARRGVFL